MEGACELLTPAVRWRERRTGHGTRGGRARHARRRRLRRRGCNRKRSSWRASTSRIWGPARTRRWFGSQPTARSWLVPLATACVLPVLAGSDDIHISCRVHVGHCR